MWTKIQYICQPYSSRCRCMNELLTQMRNQLSCEDNQHNQHTQRQCNRCSHLSSWRRNRILSPDPFANSISTTDIPPDSDISHTCCSIWSWIYSYGHGNGQAHMEPSIILHYDTYRGLTQIIIYQFDAVYPVNRIK